MNIDKMLSGCRGVDASSSQSIPEQTQLPLAKSRSTKTNITVSPDRASDLAVKSSGLPTPPSSSGKGSSVDKHVMETSASTAVSDRTPGSITTNTRSTTVSPPFLSHSKSTVSYKTLQDFYTLLDKNERTSHVGALFLEAYAKKLRDDMCKDCWFKHNIKLDTFWFGTLFLLLFPSSAIPEFLCCSYCAEGR
jgi:hypothetical protein